MKCGEREIFNLKAASAYIDIMKIVVQKNQCGNFDSNMRTLEACSFYAIKKTKV